MFVQDSVTVPHSLCVMNGGNMFSKQTPSIEAWGNMKRRRWKTTKEIRKQQVAREGSSGEDENQAHKSLDFDPAEHTKRW